MYTPSWYAGHTSSSLESARVILKVLFEDYLPASVFDVGCGSGAWLMAAEELGCTRLSGVDGPWANPTSLLSKKTEFYTVNFEKDFKVREKFDLCISVEVGEHVSGGRAASFVKTLSSAADVVLFSAAIPGQGGTYHINEQWQSYWAELFGQFGYECHDLLRPRLWTNREVASWYKQNILLYVKRSHPITEKVRTKSQQPGPLDVVHPEIYEGNLDSLQRLIAEPTLQFCGQSFGRWARRQLRKIIGRSHSRPTL